MGDDGHNLLVNSQWEKAAAHFHAVVTAAPHDASAWNNLGVALMRMGYGEAAIDAFSRALAAQADFAAARANLNLAQAQAGAVPVAAPCAEQPLAAQPAGRDAAAALNVAGNDHFAAGRWQPAADAYAQALALWPDYADAQGNLGNALRALGRMDEAVAAYRRAVVLAPDEAGHWCNLSMALQATGVLVEAAAAARRALELRPDMALAHACLGIALRDLKDLDGAIQAFQRALDLDGGLTDAIHALSGCLMERRCWDEVEALGRRALLRDPRSLDALVCLAVALQGQNRLEEALDYARRGLAMQPDNELALNVAAAALHGLDHQAEAIAVAMQGVALAPRNADLHNTLGIVLMDAGRMAEAQASLRRAIACKPDFATAHMNLGMACLQMGEFEKGWAEYEWRLRDGHEIRLWDVMPERAWRAGEDITGRVLTLHCEQGIGDLIQFSRYADRRWWGGPGRSGPPSQIVLRVPRALAGVMATVAGVDALLVDDELPDSCDVHAPLLSLPHLLGTTLETIPAAIPYIRPPAAAMDRWRGWFAAEGEAGLGGAGVPPLRVGLVWAGNPGHKGDRHRSIQDLGALAPLWAVPGVRWYSLQVGPRAADVEKLPPGQVVDLSGLLEDYGDTAAVIAHLDIVITVDTSVAHLAGAMGKPVWLLISNRPDWRWMRDRMDSPWYPTARLFRQTRMNDWSGPMAGIAAALREQAARQGFPVPHQDIFRRPFGL
ncbi:tetratricopeptide repeat protein [Nitrospirillum sp. BR 11828]|uniref:tetratricopeptide repeat protein n=1 Tax=Nitrospirillum sp. BR 11828 TaxID=3104325 RepID=UPI002ACA70F6|nr:tetratricopeptide repeat protein [Nitrospirillum sp. BR 11828]MDZ5646139.1 tetratricopeptide repeat protein [Nitrospirillum sp. BR 11828]